MTELMKVWRLAGLDTIWEKLMWEQTCIKKQISVAFVSSVQIPVDYRTL